jgi:uncharacterized RDD family membrane protein YckC
MIEGLARDSDATRYAGFWIRVAANAVDVLMLAALNRMALLASGGSGVFRPGAVLGSVSLSLGFTEIVVGGILPPLVIIGFWIALGASPGKLLLGLRIVDEPTGDRPSAWQCVGRYFMALVGILCAGIGYLWIAIDPRNQGWHDKIVRTLVVRRDAAPIGTN